MVVNAAGCHGNMCSSMIHLEGKTLCQCGILEKSTYNFDLAGSRAILKATGMDFAEVSD